MGKLIRHAKNIKVRMNFTFEVGKIDANDLNV